MVISVTPYGSGLASKNAINWSRILSFSSLLPKFCAPSAAPELLGLGRASVVSRLPLFPSCAVQHWHFRRSVTLPADHAVQHCRTSPFLCTCSPTLRHPRRAPLVPSHHTDGARAVQHCVDRTTIFNKVNLYKEQSNTATSSSQYTRSVSTSSPTLQHHLPNLARLHEQPNLQHPCHIRSL